MTGGLGADGRSGRRSCGNELGNAVEWDWCWQNCAELAVRSPVGELR